MAIDNARVMSKGRDVLRVLLEVVTCGSVALAGYDGLTI